MKILKILSLSALLLLVSNYTNAQATASATAEGTIVAPIGISNVQDMDFGNLAISATSGTVVLDGFGARTITGGVTLPAATGTITAAGFLLTGATGFTVSVTLPSAPHTITHTNNTDVMIVDNFTAPSSLTIANFTVFFVGATLNVVGSQLAGVYTSTTGFDVTVNYN